MGGGGGGGLGCGLGNVGFSISAINITDGNEDKRKHKKNKKNFYCYYCFHVHFYVSYAMPSYLLVLYAYCS